ncbi:MAG: hypothetical protein Q9169_008590, partial [Polycauliona sp. 2 TL-2023]
MEYLARTKSRPDDQFRMHRNQEREWFLKAQETVGIYMPKGTNYDNLASAIVKRRWREQGIWDDIWDEGGRISDWRWKHEPKPQPRQDPEIQALFKQPAGHQHSDPPMQPSMIHPAAGYATEAERHCEASRPIHQFLYQLARERDLIRGERTVNTDASSAPLDINTRAYENVKSAWIHNHVWDHEWGIMPGMTWMHERLDRQRPPDDPIPAHAREHSFAVAEVEAEARRLPPKPLTPPVFRDPISSADQDGLFASDFRPPTHADIDPLFRKPTAVPEKSSGATTSLSVSADKGSNPRVPMEWPTTIDKHSHNQDTGLQTPSALEETPQNLSDNGKAQDRPFHPHQSPSEKHQP